MPLNPLLVGGVHCVNNVAIYPHMRAVVWNNSHFMHIGHTDVDEHQADIMRHALQHGTFAVSIHTTLNTPDTWTGLINFRQYHANANVSGIGIFCNVCTWRGQFRVLHGAFRCALARRRVTSRRKRLALAMAFHHRLGRDSALGRHIPLELLPLIIESNLI